MQSEAAANDTGVVSALEPAVWLHRFKEGAVLAAFAGLLGAVVYRHAMYLDEAQAWLIARSSLAGLFHQLHYEAHPALWYLLLYLPAHLSVHMQWIQAINFGLSLLMAWLIISERRVPLAARGLLLFSPAIFFAMGTLARSYMLAGLLLVAAARCLTAERPRHWLAIALLALAINTHFFAIPVAGAIFVLLYWFAPTTQWATGIRALSDRRFLAGSTILLLALVVCYFTIRPAKDVYLPQYHVYRSGLLGTLTLSLSHLWHFFTPFGLDGSGSSMSAVEPLSRPYITDALLTIGAWLLAIAVLPSRRARWFFVAICVAWLAAVSATVQIAQITHCTFLIVGFAIALMIGASEPGGSWLPAYAAQPLLLVFLGVQIPLTAFFILKEFREPFSGAKATAQWLETSGLSARTLVIEPAISAPAVVGYLGASSAYLPNCDCYRSFLDYRKGWEQNTQITLDQLRTLNRNNRSAPVVLSNWEITTTDATALGLKLEFVSPKGWDWDHENFYVYESAEPGDHGSGGLSR